MSRSNDSERNVVDDPRMLSANNNNSVSSTDSVNNPIITNSTNSPGLPDASSIKDTGKDWPLAAAFQFLSRFPVPVEVNFTPGVLRRSAKYYPLVGFAIGAALGLAAVGIAWVLPPMPAAVLILALWIWLTGGLHLDGWMDAADALLSYRSRERMLEIMKDSRVGAMGVIACVLLLLLKMSLLYTLIGYGYAQVGAALLTAAIWSRWFMTYAMQAWPTARQGEGLAGNFRGLKTGSIAVSTAAALLLSAAGLTAITSLEQGNDPGSLMLLYCVAPCISWLAGTLAASRISKRLGGLTGDVYGALNEGIEAAVLLAAVICLG
ncbi:adenosylcobinamide-GDP ribazoletransferase [Paenibacillus woosongensis]|uniref:Adenosylcobinamide-GDP ribazoletransferase n=1 Tax=Paenibacillus woosongensis TaxID=307580 RepID=A0A7X2YY14_9BACL|nr:adenosylcobinamide-GDP ribazoletransferase [Paenibacillus woosongensis]MUG43997.1 adenosylcobinamide-GDP ribazoletransferase [Paenibacillus woosongensis]